MLEGTISRYERRIADEEQLARDARTIEIAAGHLQIAMLYKTELAIVRKHRDWTVGETLAEIW